MSAPAFQFYPGDWRRETALQLCSLGARGLWIECMCLMHFGNPYGTLTAGDGKPIPLQSLAKMVMSTEDETSRLMAELQTAGIPGRADNGAICSRRMIRDEALRDVRRGGGAAGAEHGQKGAEHGKKGGRPPNNPPSRGDMETPLQGAVNNPPLHLQSASASASPPAVACSDPTDQGATSAPASKPKTRKLTAFEVAWHEAVKAATGEDAPKLTQQMAAHVAALGKQFGPDQLKARAVAMFRGKPEFATPKYLQDHWGSFQNGLFNGQPKERPSPAFLREAMRWLTKPRPPDGDAGQRNYDHLQATLKEHGWTMAEVTEHAGRTA